VSLSEKGHKVIGLMVKSMAFFAVLGMLALLLGVYFVQKMLNDAIGTGSSISQPATGQPAQTAAPSHNP
jgi:hypothetical protein